MKTRDPFGQALEALRRVLGKGLAPGQRLPIADVAADLRLSTSPVREALSRLCGEGLVDDRPGLGYFTRILPAEDIIGLLQLERSHVELAMALLGAPQPGPRDLLQFGVWSANLMERCDNEPLKESFERVFARLAPVRTLNRRLEARDGGREGAGPQNLEAYYQTLIAAAQSLASAIRRMAPGHAEYRGNGV